MFPFTLEGIVRSLVFKRQLKYGYNESPVFVTGSTAQIAPEGAVFYVTTPFGEDATITKAYNVLGGEVTALASKSISESVDFKGNFTVLQFSAPSAGCFIQLKVMNLQDFATPFFLLTSPVISGTPEVGETLSVSNGTYSKTATFTYQWYLDAVPVTGQTANTYLTTTEGDVYCAVTATDNKGQQITTNSNTVTVVEP